MRVLVLGGYGLVGSEIVRRLHADGLDVVGFGRSAGKGKRLFPEIDWMSADLSTLTRVKDWTPFLAGVDAVVNASGALQTGAKDKLESTQDRAIRALIEACGAAGIGRFVQISAPGAEANATTEFLRTKARADGALRGSGLNWTILKPGLVMSAYAYGGTALLRILAAFPLVQPLMLPRAKIQTVAAEDVAATVATAGISNIELAAKFRFLHQDTFGLDVAVFPRVFLPSGSNLGDQHASLLVPIWLGKTGKSGSTFGGGSCALNRGGDSRDYCLIGWAVSHNVGTNLHLGAELFHQSADTTNVSASTILGAGATYDLSEKIHLLGYLGAGLQNAAETGRGAWYTAVLFTL